MKKIFIYCSILFFATNCTMAADDINPNAINLNDQFKYIISGEGAKKLANQGLKVIEILESDISIEEVSDEKQWIPVYQDIKNINAFVLQEYENLNNNYQLIIRNRRLAILNEYNNAKLKLFKIKWKYNNEVITSDCITCNSDIVYDNIISNIRYMEIVMPNDTKNKLPKTKSRSEGGTNISYSYTTPIYQHTGVFGVILAQAYCTMSATGRQLQDGKYLDDYDMHTYHHNATGYKADAQVQVRHFKAGLNGYVEFVYAIGVSDSINFGINWNGLYFTMTGEISGTTASATISAQKLQ